MESQGFFKDLVKFIFSFTFLKHFTASLLIGFILILIAVFFMNSFTNHGQSLSVPGFKGLTFEQAQELADDKEIHIEILDSVFNAPGKRGTIVEQNPPQDFKVKENRTVFVTIKALNPEMITMPNFINSTLIQTKADIETYGLKVGKLIYKPWKYDNLVIEQRFDGKKIKVGEKIEKGSYIDLVLGRTGDYENTNVPQLIGLERDAAEMEIAEMMLNVGSVVFDKTVETEEDSLNATVVKQFPGKNVSLIPGSEVDIWLSLKNDSIN
jgi:beta-lactam-binding protein with PASTA domain